MNGTVNPDEIQIEGLETEEQKRKKEVQWTKLPCSTLV